MSKQKRRPVDFRFYDMPDKDPILIFYGDKWKRVYGTGAPNLHFHNVLEIGLCRQGRGEMVYDRETRPYREGDISILPRGTLHNTVNPDHSVSWWEYIFVDAHAYLAKAFPDNEHLAAVTEERIRRRHLLLHGAEHEELFRLADTVICESYNKNLYTQEIQHALVQSLLLLVARENDDAQDEMQEEKIVRVQNTLHYVDQNYAQTVSPGDLAAAAHMSETHFRRVFRDCMHMSPADYLNMVRIQKACEMLLRTDLPMDLVAQKSGFASLSTFNRNFRSFTDDSPLHWRNTHRLSGDNIHGIEVSPKQGWTDDIR